MSGFITGSVISAYGSNQAAKKQLEGQREATAAQERMFYRQLQLQEPFRMAGVNALPELIAASRYTPFSMQQFKADPGYAFRLQEGLKSLDRSAAARGGLLSGATLKGALRYGQDMGSQEYTNAFNRYQAERAARLNPLQSLAGMGQTSANTLSNEAGQYGQNMAQSATQMGNIRASNYVNTANALTSGLSGYLNQQQNQQMMDRFFPQQTPNAAPTYGSPYDLNAQNYG